MIHVLTLHPCPMLVQRNCWYDNKIYTRTTWVISNYCIKTFVAEEYVVDLSIPQRLEIYKGQNNHMNGVGVPIIVLCVLIFVMHSTRIFIYNAEHCIVKMALINVLESIPTYSFFDLYHTLKNYRIHTLWTTWQLMDVQWC